MVWYSVYDVFNLTNVFCIWTISLRKTCMTMLMVSVIQKCGIQKQLQRIFYPL